MKRWLIRIGVIVGALFIVLTGLAWVLGATETGLHWLVGTVNAMPLKSVKVHIDNAGGTLVGGFTIGAVRVTSERAEVLVGTIDGAVDFWHLVSGGIALDHANVAHVRVTVHTRAPTEDSPVKFFPRLLRLHVEKFTAHDVDIALPNGAHLTYDRVSARADLTSSSIDAASLDAHAELVSARGSVRLIASQPLALSADLEWQLTPARQPAWRGHAHVTGDLERLAYGVDTAVPFRATGRGELTNLTKSWRMHGTLAILDFDVKPWRPDSKMGPVSADLDIGASRDGLFASGKVTPRDLGTGTLRVRYRGRYVSQTLHFDEFVFGPDTQRGEMIARGTIAFQQGAPQLDFSAEWQQLQWPLRGPAIVSSERGRGTLAGKWPLHFTATASLRVRDLPAAQFTSRGEIASGRIALDDAHGTWLAGNVDARGEIRYDENAGWSAEAHGTKLNPALWQKAWAGSLDFALHAAAPSLKSDALWHVDIDRVRGRLRGQSLSASGSVRRLDRGLGFERVALDFGSTHARLDGSLAEEIALRWDVSSPDLARTLPGAAGRLETSGTLRGQSEAFAVKARLEASGLAYTGFSVRRLTADVDVDLVNRAPSRATITADGIAWSGHELDALRFALEGTTDAHDWSLAAQADDSRVELGGRGRYAAGLWTTALSNWTLDAGDSPHMTLVAPATLTIGSDQLGLTPACLAANDERFCAEGALNADGLWELKASAVRMPLRFLGSYLAAQPQFGGYLAMQVDATGKPDAPWTGTARVDLSDAAFQYRLERGQISTLTLGEAHADLVAAPDRFSGAIKVRPSATSFLDTNIGVTRQPDRAFADQTLSGTLRAEIHELGLIPLFVAEVDRVDGTLATEFQLGGTANAPEFDGKLRVDAKAIDLYQINLQLRDTVLTARLKDNTLNIDGTTHAGEGEASIKGQLAWNAQLPHGILTLGGKNLRLVDVPEVRIVASPDISMRVDGRRIDIDGEVTVPYARIAPVQLTGAVLSSSDEVIVGTEITPPEKRFQVYSRLRLMLGNDVRIESYGLRGKLSGSVTASSRPDDQGTGVGELKVDEGEYMVLARLLDIERGRLVFTGGPLSNPGVDIQAVRRLPDITVGANVRGTLREPTLSFFSDPPISQTQIVSLLVAGGTLESLQDNAAQQASNSRNQLLAQGGAILASALSAQLGLPDVTVESTRQNETSLVLGKYLSPRLYVSYGVSLTEAINTLKLRYTLGDRWTIRVESGENNATDIIYTIEK